MKKFLSVLIVALFVTSMVISHAYASNTPPGINILQFVSRFQDRLSDQKIDTNFEPSFIMYKGKPATENKPIMFGNAEIVKYDFNTLDILLSSLNYDPNDKKQLPFALAFISAFLQPSSDDSGKPPLSIKELKDIVHANIEKPYSIGDYYLVFMKDNNEYMIIAIRKDYWSK